MGAGEDSVEIASHNLSTAAAVVVHVELMAFVPPGGEPLLDTFLAVATQGNSRDHPGAPRWGCCWQLRRRGTVSADAS